MLILDLKICLFTRFWAKRKFYSKIAINFIEKKSEKKVMSQSRENSVTDGRTDRAYFIEPSGKTGVE